jgi:hypothetical protein
MKQIRLLLLVFAFLLASLSTVLSQENRSPTNISTSYVLEVMYIKGRPLAYQRIGGWTWYEGLQPVAGFKPPTGARPVEAVKLYTREEAGAVKVRVTVLRGANLEFEDEVGQYTVGIERVTLHGLTNFGITPFDIVLVRAPSTIPYLPAINNGTKSLAVSVEPIVAIPPSFKARFVNNSAKAVGGFAYHTWLDGRRRFIGMPQQFDGTPLIAPGGSYEKVFPYALQPKTESDGEMPQPLQGLQLNVTAVMFMDGTWEGDRLDAAHFKGYKQGEKVQLSRILGLLHSKSAANWDTLAPKVDELSYRITVSDIDPLLKEFPGLPDSEVENLRSAAEVSASRIQKDFVGTFGTGKTIDSGVFNAAVNGAIAKCEKWLDSLP